MDNLKETFKEEKKATAKSGALKTGLGSLAAFVVGAALIGGIVAACIGGGPACAVLVPIFIAIGAIIAILGVVLMVVAIMSANRS